MSVSLCSVRVPLSASCCVRRQPTSVSVPGIGISGINCRGLLLSHPYAIVAATCGSDLAIRERRNHGPGHLTSVLPLQPLTDETAAAWHCWHCSLVVPYCLSMRVRHVWSLFNVTMLRPGFPQFPLLPQPLTGSQALRVLSWPTSRSSANSLH